jgi:putative ABC transport system substrate-binding protein
MTTHRGPNPALVSRRAILAGAAAMLAPGRARAQSGPPHRLGWISTEPEPDPFVDGFREGMRRLGYTEGRDFVLELRYAPGNLDRLRAAATELISSRVAFLVASGPAVRAIKTVRDVPVLFVISGDPVALGIAATVARPGGNFTGFTFLSLEIAGKRVELLKQAIPPLRTLVALSNTDHPGEPAERRATEAAAQALGLKLIYVPFGSLAEIDAALGRCATRVRTAWWCSPMAPPW